MAKLVSISFQEWVETYKPLIDNGNVTPYSNLNQEDMAVLSTTPDTNIWSLIDVQGENTIASGYWIVNSFNTYMISEVAVDLDVAVMVNLDPTYDPYTDYDP